MALDRDAQVPVRSEQDEHERLHVKLVDGADPSLRMQIDTDKNAHVEVHGNKPTTGDDVALRLSELGALNSDGVYDAANNTKPSHTGLVVHNRQVAPADADCVKRVTGITAGSVHAADVSLHDENGIPYGKTNPLHVEVAPPSGARVIDYDHAIETAKDASTNHDYTVADYALDLSKVECSSSGKCRFELQVSADGVAFDTLGVKFCSANVNNVEWNFPFPKVVPVGGKVRIIKQNRDHDDNDNYSTIYGVQTLSSPG
jgi:hypothetical protein